MFKTFIEWTEGEVSRGRKVVLFSTVGVFLSITLVLFTGAISGVVLSTGTTTLYVTLVGLMAAIYGFYTGTNAKSDSSLTVVDKASEIMIEKLDKIKR